MGVGAGAGELGCRTDTVGIRARYFLHFNYSILHLVAFCAEKECIHIHSHTDTQAHRYTHTHNRAQSGSRTRLRIRQHFPTKRPASCKTFPTFPTSSVSRALCRINRGTKRTKFCARLPANSAHAFIPPPPPTYLYPALNCKRIRARKSQCY